MSVQPLSFLPSSQEGNSLPLYGVALSLVVTAFSTVQVAKPKPLYTAAWATLSQLSSLIVRVTNAFHAPIRHALLLATLEGKLLGIKPTRARPELGHMLICGPTRSGKSQHLMCNLLNWSGSAVIIDIKGEMHRQTSGHRNRFTDVVVLDPSGWGQRYDPFADIGSTAEALQTAAEVALQISRDTEPVFAQRGSNAVIAARRAAYLLNISPPCLTCTKSRAGVCGTLLRRLERLMMSRCLPVWCALSDTMCVASRKIESKMISS